MFIVGDGPDLFPLFLHVLYRLCIPRFKRVCHVCITPQKCVSRASGDTLYLVPTPPPTWSPIPGHKKKGEAWVIRWHICESLTGYAGASHAVPWPLLQHEEVNAERHTQQHDAQGGAVACTGGGGVPGSNLHAKEVSVDRSNAVSSGPISVRVVLSVTDSAACHICSPSFSDSVLSSVINNTVYKGEVFHEAQASNSTGVCVGHRESPSVPNSVAALAQTTANVGERSVGIPCREILCGLFLVCSSVAHMMDALVHCLHPKLG